MSATGRSFRGVGFDGSVCADHAPSMEGEGKCEPGYEILGLLFPLGYLKGLVEAPESGPLDPWCATV